MQKKIILFLLIFLFSCNSQKDAVGDSNTITIISSNKDKIYSEHIIKHFFENKNKSINTPQLEYVYNIEWADLSDLNCSKMMKNILFLSLSHPSDSTIDILSSKILKQNNIKSNFAIFDDLFAKGQKAIVLKVTDAVELEKQCESYSTWIYSEYDSNIYDSYYNYLKANGSDDELENLIKDKFNLSVFIQKDYEIISDKENFTWIGRGYPYRWLLFYKIPLSRINNNPYDIFGDIIQEYNLNITDVDNRDYHKRTSLKNGKIDVFRGIYSHSDTGGPFSLYILDNVNDDEVILVASIINNPGKSKMSHMLQIDALISNVKF